MPCPSLGSKPSHCLNLKDGRNLRLRWQSKFPLGLGQRLTSYKRPLTRRVRTLDLCALIKVSGNWSSSGGKKTTKPIKECSETPKPSRDLTTQDIACYLGRPEPGGWGKSRNIGRCMWKSVSGSVSTSRCWIYWPAKIKYGLTRHQLASVGTKDPLSQRISIRLGKYGTLTRGYNTPSTIPPTFPTSRVYIRLKLLPDFIRQLRMM